MNILMVLESDDPLHSATVRSVLALAAECRRRGHRVLLIAPHFDGEMESEDSPDTLRIPAVKGFGDADFALTAPWVDAYREQIDDFRPSIVHSHHPFVLGAGAVRIASRHSIPLVFTYHTHYERETHGIPTHWTTLKGLAGELAVDYCQLADIVFAPSAPIAAFLHDRGVKTEVEIVPRGLDVEHFRAGNVQSLRGRLEIGESDFVVGYFEKAGSDVNLSFLARNVGRFLQSHEGAHLLSIARGNEHELAKRIADDFAVGNRVHRLAPDGPSDIVSGYDAMDLLVAGTRAVAPTLEIVEGMSAGVPTVAYDTAQARGLIEDGSNGWLLRSERGASLFKILKQAAAASDADRCKWSENARTTAATYSVASYADQCLSLYALVTQATRHPKFDELSRWEMAGRRLSVEWDIWTSRAHAATALFTSGRYPSRVPVLRYFINAWRRFRRWVSRREWSVNILNLSVSDGTADEPGLILLQIDGLARCHLEEAVRRGRMPFVRSLLERECYRIHTLYSGQPTTTPAVLAELFYGVEQAVPAFGFRDHRVGEEVRMYHPSVAARIQQELEQKGAALLDGGSAYADIYSGGAQEASFCPATAGWRYIEDVNVWRRVALILLNVVSLLRILGMSLVELAVGLYQCVRGIRKGFDAVAELLYVPRRVIVNTVLRELIAISVEADATRGVPVVHANFLGYDENAHRRGPDAKFAHMALRGIDHAIHRIWNAANASERREYHFWIMSDHGQESVVQYGKRERRSVQDAVDKVYREVMGTNARPTQSSSKRKDHAVELQSATWLRSKRKDGAAGDESSKQTPEPAGPITIAVGPLGYIYCPDALNDSQIETIAQRLVEAAHIPIVMAPLGDQVFAWTKQGQFRMPEEAEKILAEDHPHLPEVGRDLTSLCFHPDGGQFVICGWQNDDTPVTFVPENGAHGGPGPDETSGFFLVPPDAPQPYSENGIFRPLTLRQMALQVLRRAPARHTRPVRPRSGNVVRLVTYNAHSCIGLDGKLSPSRIARVLATASPDIIALQELDVWHDRSRLVDQAEQIARALDMQLHFHPSFEVEEGQYGNAILSRFPLKLVRAGRLPSKRNDQQPRGALWVEVDVGGTPLQVITTHLGLSSAERVMQAETLLGEQWLSHPDCREPVVLCGDLNMLPGSKAYRTINTKLRDVQKAVGRRQPQRTWFAPFPLTRIDHVFIGGGLSVKQVDIPRTRLSRVASDHLPLVVDLEMQSKEVERFSEQPHCEMASAVHSEKLNDRRSEVPTALNERHEKE